MTKKEMKEGAFIAYNNVLAYIKDAKKTDNRVCGRDYFQQAVGMLLLMHSAEIINDTEYDRMRDDLFGKYYVSVV